MSLAEAQAAHAAAQTELEARTAAAARADAELAAADPDDAAAYDSAAAAAKRAAAAVKRAAALDEDCAGDVAAAKKEQKQRGREHALERGEIAGVLERLEATIAQLADAERALAVDELDAAIAADDLGRAHGQRIAARRAVRAAVLEQHGHVDRAIELSAALGETIPRNLVHIREENVLALAGIERLALAPELDLTALHSIRFVDKHGALNNLDHPRSSRRWRPTWSSADWLRIARRAARLASWRDAMEEEPLTKGEADERQRIANAPSLLDPRPARALGSTYDARRGYRPRQEPTS